MDQVEIKRYIDNLQGVKHMESEEEEFTNINTKTRGQTAFHEEIHLDLETNNVNKTPLEIDENDLPLSVKTEQIHKKKAGFSNAQTPKNKSTLKVHQTDEKLNDRSIV